MIKEIILKNRSYRRFDGSIEVPMTALKNMIELARFSASGSNNQPLKFIICNNPVTNESIFSALSWAGALKNWDGPEFGERPTAYIIILHDTTISNDPGVDHGIAAQSILLGAVEAGFGGCMLGAINRPKLRELLKLEKRYKTLLVIALGKPVENVILEDLVPGSSPNYHRDEAMNHYVPKRLLKELIIKSYKS